MAWRATDRALVGFVQSAPEPGFDLVSGNLAGGAHGTIVVTRLDLRERVPTVHRVQFSAKTKGQTNRDGAEVHFHPG